MPEAPIRQFGIFEVNLTTGELRKRGIRLKLQDQPFRILVLLLEHPGQVITRDAIQSALWPHDTFVEFDRSISAAVAKLRVALSDSAESPRFIETVARHGYRFIAPVTLRAVDESPPSSQSANPSQPTASPTQPSAMPILAARRQRMWMLLGIGAIAVVIAGMVMLVSTTKTGRNETEAELRSIPLTSYPGTEAGPSFAPDGTRVAFSWDGLQQDNVDIYVKLIGSGEPVRLTKDPADDHDPAWSPDGKWIAFNRDLNDAEVAILLVPALGGPERELARTRNVKDPIVLVNSPLLSWSPDSKWLFALDAGSRGRTYAVVRIAKDSGVNEQVTAPPPDTVGDRAVAVSPDGRSLAILREGKHAQTDLYRISLSQPSPAAHSPELILGGAWIEGIAWTADSREIVFSCIVGGKAGLWRIGARSHTPRLLSGVGEGSVRWKRMGRSRGANLAISRDGRRLVYSQGAFDANVWRMGLKGGEKGKVTRFLASTRDELQPAYSDDGRKIAFESDRSGVEEIWACDAEGVGPFQVTDFGSG